MKLIASSNRGWAAWRNRLAITVLGLTLPFQPGCM